MYSGGQYNTGFNNEQQKMSQVQPASARKGTSTRPRASTLNNAERIPLSLRQATAMIDPLQPIAPSRAYYPPHEIANQLSDGPAIFNQSEMYGPVDPMQQPTEYASDTARSPRTMELDKRISQTSARALEDGLLKRY